MIGVYLRHFVLILIVGLSAAQFRFDWPDQGPWIVEFDKSVDHSTFRNTLQTVYNTILDPLYPLDITIEYHTVLWGVALSGLTLAQLEAIPAVTNVDADSLKYADEDNWGLDRIDQANLPLDDDTYDPDYTGRFVNVYVIDTGVDCTHTEFANIVCQNIYNGYGELSSNTDGQGHGSHCAGTVAGRTIGVARQVNLYGGKGLSDSGSGQTSLIVQAFETSVDHCEASGRRCVITMSLGGGCFRDFCGGDSYTNAIASAVYTKDIVVTVSAGNDYTNSVRHKSPAASIAAITTGASDIRDVQSVFSNYGEGVDVFGPGSSIVSVCSSLVCGGSTTRYSTKSGTSMSTPHAAGVAAQLLQKSSSAAATLVRKAMFCDATVNALTFRGSYSGSTNYYDTVTKNLMIQTPKNDGQFGTCDQGVGNCPDNCSGNGVCHPAYKSSSYGTTGDICHCYGGYYGDNCLKEISANYYNYPSCDAQGANTYTMTFPDGEWSTKYAAFAFSDPHSKIVAAHFGYDRPYDANDMTFCLTPGYYLFRTSAGAGFWRWQCGATLLSGTSNAEIYVRIHQDFDPYSCEQVSASDVPDPDPTFAPTTPPPPTASPTKGPTQKPSARPSGIPTRPPTGRPTAAPVPTFLPTYAPTATPTFSPSSRPTNKPSAPPTHKPSHAPTHRPTALPTRDPTKGPTRFPTASPTPRPTRIPTPSPSAPSAHPTQDPTATPSTAAPSAALSFVFTVQETLSGVAYADYVSNKAQHKAVLAESIERTLGHDIEATVLEVTADSSSKSKKMRGLSGLFRTAADGYHAECEVFVPNAYTLGYSTGEEAYDALSSQLRHAADDGTLAANLRQAAQDEGVSELEGATLSNVGTTEESYPTVAPTHEEGYTGAFWTNEKYALVGLGVFVIILVIPLTYLLCTCLVPSCAYCCKSKQVDSDPFNNIFAKAPPHSQNSNAPPMAATGTGTGMQQPRVSAFVTYGNAQYEMSSAPAGDVTNPMKVKWGHMSGMPQF